MRRRASFCQVAALVVVAHGVYACGDSGGTSANNDGTASAADIEQLIQHVMATVQRVHGVQLKPEVRIVGEGR